jgi:hypothetical protein
MNITNKYWAAYQRKRWVRPDFHRWQRRAAAWGQKANAPLQIKYSPDQPRDEQGRWANEGDGDQDADVASIVARAEKFIAAGRSPSYLQCLEMCSRLLERPKPYPWSDRNMYDYLRCMDECQKQ